MPKALGSTSCRQKNPRRLNLNLQSSEESQHNGGRNIYIPNQDSFGGLFFVGKKKRKKKGRHLNAKSDYDGNGG